MSFEQVTKVIELILTVVGLMFVVFGWIIPYRQNQKMEEERKKAETILHQKQWEKELVDAQIAEFYGPISALLQEQDILFNRVLEMLGRRHVFSSDQTQLSELPENEQKIWAHYVDTYKLPLNNRIIEIIRDKKHLVYNSEIPNCFRLYLDYSLGWEFLDNQKRHGVPNYYEYYYCYNYPKQFTTYINETLEILLKKQAELIGQVKE